jgi:glycerol-3-phosphate acyltransferase PlsY
MLHPDLIPFLLWCLAAYIAGSIPFGLILVRIAGKGDVRETGSGNIGATNVIRAGGKILGILTLLLDIAKGFVPVFLAKRHGFPPVALSWIALAAVVGHIFTPWLRFKGGKGVATALGVVLAYHAPMVLPALGVFLFLLIAFRYVSLGSIGAALVLIPTALGFLGSWASMRFDIPGDFDPRFGMLAWVLMPMLVVRRHGSNIQRLLGGTESPLWGSRPPKAGDE